ncbi:hypothetical protein NDU88_007186 [Pleurodeles waltl]|uniref:Uncharacterized protein n=1 Tax=Pleurodeles waltl TaxID=8319 RepID=A0AAV7P1G6_PLEWA|nr:hypothetical protein NDU88_007186 [Pleurodeles waltl]
MEHWYERFHGAPPSAFRPRRQLATYLLSCIEGGGGRAGSEARARDGPQTGLSDQEEKGSLAWAAEERQQHGSAGGDSDVGQRCPVLRLSWERHSEEGSKNPQRSTDRATQRGVKPEKGSV